jgi:hypothetical protein
MQPSSTRHIGQSQSVYLAFLTLWWVGSELCIFYHKHLIIFTRALIDTGYGLDGPGIESRWGARFSAPVQTGPGAHPASCTMGTGSFLGVKSGWGLTLTPHPLLVPWSRKGRTIPLFPLWAVRPVQSLSASTRVDFTFFLLIDKCGCTWKEYLVIIESPLTQAAFSCTDFPSS